MEKWKFVRKILLNMVPIIVVFGVASVYSAYVTHENTAGITIAQTSVKVYSDAAATELVTHLDFGVVTQGGQSVGRTLWLKNHGSGSVQIYWTSTLFSAISPTQVIEQWAVQGVPWNNTVMSAGQVYQTDYVIGIGRTLATGTYNWTLTVGVTET